MISAAVSRSIRTGGSSLGRSVLSRHFSGSNACLAAQNFAMPAMSPTMTEGGIVDWKVKEGDVLLEIETDKAQIDVEAADDGILAKIYAENGSKDIPVGKTIAVIAEPGDDIGSLEIPAPEAGGVGKAAEPPKKEEPKNEIKKEEPKQEKKQEKAIVSSGSSGSSGSSATAADPKQTLLPSVAGLLSANSISNEEAFKNITASGPNGRLLKGDVLVYLGKASRDTINQLDKEIAKLSKLDLSNVQIKSDAKGSAAAPTKTDAKSAPAPPARSEPIVLKQVYSLADLELLQSTLEETLGSSVSLTKLVNQASAQAQKDVTHLSKPRKSVLYDPVFESLIAPTNRVKPFEVDIELPKRITKKKAVASSSDIFSLLASSKGYSSSFIQAEVSDLIKVKVTVNEKAPDAKKKADLFLQQLEYYLGVGKGDLLF